MAKALIISNADFSSVKVAKSAIYKKNQPKWDFRMLSHASSATYYYYGASIYSRIGVFGVGDWASDCRVPTSSSDTVGNPYAIKIPSGATSVKISRASNKASEFVSGQQGYIYFAKDTPCGDATYPDAPTYVGESTFDLSSNQSVTINVPTGANCFNFFTRLSGSYSSANNPQDVAKALGLFVDFV